MNGELVGIEGGTRGHREDLAGVRVHGDNAADLAFKGFLGCHLDRSRSMVRRMSWPETWLAPGP